MTAPAAAPAPLSQKLRSSAEVRAVFATRRLVHGETVVAHARDRGDAAPARWTVVAGKKVGDAVRRNRAKRRLRAVLATTPLPEGVDLVIVARADAHVVGPAVLRRDVEETVEKAGVRARATRR